LTAARVAAADATLIIDTPDVESDGVVWAIVAEKRTFPLLVKSNVASLTTATWDRPAIAESRGLVRREIIGVDEIVKNPTPRSPEGSFKPKWVNSLLVE
jgi:hypothetical protein